MIQGFEMVRDTLLKAEARPVYFLLACASVLFLLVRRKRKEEKLLGVYSAVMLLTFLCPLSALVIAPLLRKGEVYWRYLWLFPTAVLIGCAGVILITERSRRLLNVLTGLLVAAVLVLGGRNLYAAGYFSKAANKDKVDAMTVQVESAIEEIRSTTKRKYAKLAAPQNVSAQIREINSHVIVHARRNLNLDWVRIHLPRKYKTLAVLFGVAVDDEHRAVRRLKYARCNYILMFDRAGCNDDLAAKGYHIISSGDDWNLWFNPRVKKKKSKARARKARRARRARRRARRQARKQAQAEKNKASSAAAGSESSTNINRENQ